MAVNLATGDDPGRRLSAGCFFLFPVAPSWNQKTSSELWNLRNSNLTLLGEAVMARILHETLLLSCMAAFAISLVLAGASLFG
jgi:hypothetical protein